MQVLSFSYDGVPDYGLDIDGGVRAAGAELRAECGDLKSALERWTLAELAERMNGSEYATQDIRWLPPITNPARVLCIGANYRPHIEEMGREPPERPMVFVRFASSLTGHLEALRRPSISTQFDYEGELAVVIGRPAWRLSAAEAPAVIAGYSIFMDGSVRDWQRHTSQFTPGKNFPASGAMGPCLVSPDALRGDAELCTWVNDELRQRGRIDELVFPVAELIAYCSQFTPLAPGDVIATGTPGGVGAAQSPPVWLAPGDTVRVQIEGLGELCCPVVAE